VRTLAIFFLLLAILCLYLAFTFEPQDDDKKHEDSITIRSGEDHEYQFWVDDNSEITLVVDANEPVDVSITDQSHEHELYRQEGLPHHEFDDHIPESGDHLLRIHNPNNNGVQVDYEINTVSSSNEAVRVIFTISHVRRSVCPLTRPLSLPHDPPLRQQLHFIMILFLQFHIHSQAADHHLTQRPTPLAIFHQIPLLSTNLKGVQ